MEQRNKLGCRVKVLKGDEKVRQKGVRKLKMKEEIGEREGGENYT